MKSAADAVCPRCGAMSLRVTVFADGAKRHECAAACAYLMVWKPTEMEVSRGRN